MPLQVKASLIGEGEADRGPDAAGHPPFTSFVMPADPRQAVSRKIARKLTTLQPLSSGRLQRPRTLIPRDHWTHRPGNVHPFPLSKDFSASPPFMLGHPERYNLKTNPALLFSSMFVLNGRNTFSAKNCHLSRPKVNYPAYNPLPAKDNQRSLSYPDPMVGASRSFIHRISELSCLEGETVRHEKLRKVRKFCKPSS